jgi:hypothetical protein
LLQRSRRLLLPALRSVLLLACFAAVAAPAFPAASLQPTRAGLIRQSLGAREADYSLLQDDRQVHEFVRKGLLVTMRGNADYHIDDDVRHAAGRPEVKAFVERLAKQYRASCREKLVVTSLVRPRSRQPWNSDPLSVHPAGMAVDLRISSTSACRRWLEDTLLELEGKGLVEAARERVVPHYHVVVFPAYARYLEQKGIELPEPGGIVLASARGGGPIGLPSLLPAASRPASSTAAGGTAPAVQRTSSTASAATVEKPAAARRTVSAKSSSSRATTRRYKVKRGDNLWTIARRHGVSVQSIKRANNRVASRIKPGQVLAIPAR